MNRSSQPEIKDNKPQADKKLLKRHFTRENIHPYNEVEWEKRTALIGTPDNPVFEQHGVEVPKFWSQNATNIVAQKYFAYSLQDERREYSVKQLIDRVVHTIREEGKKHNYFNSKEEINIFSDELTYILLHQYAAFNSPVWFNLGVKGAKPQSSACYILHVDDSLESISKWQTDETQIFRYGSGSGVNLSNLRGSEEPISKGGQSSGPVTFMRGADANAGTLKSGGVKRRAAKMVILDDDHPDIEDFITCKAREEDRIRALASAGFDMALGSAAGERNLAEATAYQNANNSVRVSDDFMKAVRDDKKWSLVGRVDNRVYKTVRAREIMELIADATWKCADPGMQYKTTINDWHTTPAQGPITGSNPCSEYMSNDNTACNLASLNLLKFFDEDNGYDIESFRHVTRTIFLAQEITISFAHFPTPDITKNTRALRQIGIGYANLGALLMSQGIAYDSDEGRLQAAALTALLTGEAYLESARISKRMGAFTYYEENKEDMLRVLDKHNSFAKELQDDSLGIASHSKKVWNSAVKEAKLHGVRNAQASVLAPTGTISFLLDCDTTGIEPDFALIKMKTLAGGGLMTIVNSSVPRALKALGYSQPEIDDIISYIEEEENNVPRGHVQNAPHLKQEHYPVFDCAVGERSIAPMGHISMMASVQPFLSGAISKTVNIPERATREDIMQLYLTGWEKGLKAIAIYRDNSKNSQPLMSRKEEKDEEIILAKEERLTSLLEDGLLRGERRKLSRNAEMIGVNFDVGLVGGYISVRLFEDQTPGALFVDVGQAGSTLHGFIRAWAVTMSIALQYGTPLSEIISKLAWSQFEPAGITDDPEIRTAKSIVDYVVKWLALNFLDKETHAELGIIKQEIDNTDDPLPGGDINPRIRTKGKVRPIKIEDNKLKLTASQGATAVCPRCGGAMTRTGTCMTCQVCGDTSGCG